MSKTVEYKYIINLHPEENAVKREITPIDTIISSNEGPILINIHPKIEQGDKSFNPNTDVTGIVFLEGLCNSITFQTVSSNCNENRDMDTTQPFYIEVIDENNINITFLGENSAPSS